MKNTFSEKLHSGKKCIGTFAHIDSEIVVEALVLAEVDFVIFDGEHSTMAADTVQKLARAVLLHGVTSFARTRDHSRSAILSMLEAGAQGLIIPQVSTVDEVLSIVEYARYYPDGNRGVFLGESGGYGYLPFAEAGLASYFETCNRETLLFPQCETAGCLEHIEEIARIEGIDGIFIGPYDLSVALSMPGDFQNPTFLAAIARIKAAVKAAGKHLIMYTADKNAVAPYLADGFDAFTLNVDVALLIELLRTAVRGARA